MKFRSCIALIAAATLGTGWHLTPAHAATTLYVAPAGNDNSACSSVTSPCATIQHAMNMAQSGDGISIAAGTYREHLSVPNSVNLQGPTNGTAIVDGTHNGVVLMNTARVFLSYLTLQNGSGISGGGVVNSGSLTIDHSVIRDNSAMGSSGSSGIPASNGYGGGIYNSGDLTVQYSTISNNRAIGGDSGVAIVTPGGSGIGGGIFNTSRFYLTVNTSTFSGNLAIGGAGSSTPGVSSGTGHNGGEGDGGAIATVAGGSITTSLFINNRALGGFGGALDASLATTGGTGGDARGGAINNNIVFGGATVVSNSTFAGNSAAGGLGGTGGTGGVGGTADGGAVRNRSGSLTLVNVTMASDTATGGVAGVGGTDDGAAGASLAAELNADSSVTIKNTILANTGTATLCTGTVTGDSHNLQSTGGNCAGIPAGDAKLNPLANNGGPTQTMALAPGSAALNAGDDTVCAAAPVNAVDQRGDSRPFGPHCNLGAFEGVAAAPTAARVSRLTMNRHGSSVTFRWRLAVATGVRGFNLYAGGYHLNRRLIPVHRSASYSYAAHWAGTGSYSLHVVLTDGTEIVFPLH